MKRLYILIICLISFNLSAQEEVSADWNVTVNGNEITLSIVEFNNFTVGLDGHWHYILNEEEYVAVHDINDVIISDLPDGEHTIYIWLVDHMHNAIDPPVEETITFNIDTGLSTTDNEKLDMRIYPNPVNENFVTIISPVQGLKEIEVYSVTGRKLMDTRTYKSTLNLSSFNSGIYMVKVTINGQSKVSKLVVR
tara:strand:- start:144 stop:725 length:582 start_codon:yes stop_codon:yes gene_type:complete